ncbi:MAG TPA: hypothetical protein VID70_05595 [Solirubrobacteraceae bacterium]|jgi:hypothetical protein
MRRRAVHRVYAEEEQAVEQPPWRLQQQGRVIVMALLGAAVAFVAVLAIHALTRHPAVAVPGADGNSAVQTAPQQVPPAPTVVSRRDRSHLTRNPRHPFARVKRRHSAAVALRHEGHVVIRISTVSAAPPAPQRASATSEFTFER